MKTLEQYEKLVTENGTLYLGDCIEIMELLPEKSIDLICTDPPYGIEYNQNDLAAKRESAFGGNIKNQKPNGIINDGEKEAFKLFIGMLKLSATKLLKIGACCCCCCGGGGGPKPLFARWVLLMDRYIGFTQAVVWDKGGLGMGMHYRRNYEFILIAQNGAPSLAWNGGKNTPNVWRINKIIPEADQHPTEKPVELMYKIINIHSNPGMTVLDPFSGSGTTALAAIRTGRKFIAIEKDPRFFEMSKKKILSETQQIKLF